MPDGSDTSLPLSDMHACRVFTNDAHSLEFPDAWCTSVRDDGHLIIMGREGDTIAAFAPGHWYSFIPLGDE